MSSLYELYSKRTKYRALRENVINAIGILSRAEVSDSISTAETFLNNNYQLDEVGCRTDKLRNVRDSLSSDISNLNACLSSINSKIYSINKEIEEKEAAEGAAA